MKRKHILNLSPALKTVCSLSILTFLTVSSGTAGNENDTSVEVTKQLALELVAEQKHEPAAIEYRRIAMTVTNSGQKAGYYWASSFEYKNAGNYELSAKMLDQAENYSQNLVQESFLLRAENSYANDYLDEAAFYLRSLKEKTTNDNIKAFACRRLAHTSLASGDITAAREYLINLPAGDTNALSRLDIYAKGRDKRPKLGGLLGTIPGMGYAYAGEYANALRSFILNGLFIYGMADTASDKEWGAFSVITFFEITWYTGSIYGGIDATHRYNKTRMKECMDYVDGDTSFTPDFQQMPVITLKFSF